MSEATPPLPASFGLQARLGLYSLVVCAALTLFWPRSSGTDAAPGMLIDENGRPVRLGELLAPVTLLHFWSTWCPPCLDEVPAIQRLADDYVAEHDFSLVMVAVDDDVGKVRAFLGDRFSRSLYDNDWKVARRFRTEKLPETHLLVGGQIVESFIGATNWDDPAVRQRVDEALRGLSG